MSNLLARYADATFWMARYMERAENLARILDVNETFSRDTRGGQNWLSLLQLYDDKERFFARNAEATAAAVIHFHVLDRENPGSILSAVRAARQNARTLRPLISTEMWIHLNIFYNRLSALTEADVSEHRLARLCGFIKDGCQTHSGITEGTFYRDAGWYFYQLGRNLERADQTTRLLDVKYHLLLPSVAEVGSPFDVSQWNALLRSASGYHAFRRVHPSGMTPAAVAGFLLFHQSFPRSVAGCITAFDAMLDALIARYGLTGGGEVATEVDKLRAALSEDQIDDIISRGLHEYIDGVQLKLAAITGELAQAFFGLEAADAPSPAEASTEA